MFHFVPNALPSSHSKPSPSRRAIRPPCEPRPSRGPQRIVWEPPRSLGATPPRPRPHRHTANSQRGRCVTWRTAPSHPSTAYRLQANAGFQRVRHGPPTPLTPDTLFHFVSNGSCEPATRSLSGSPSGVTLGTTLPHPQIVNNPITAARSLSLSGGSLAPEASPNL